MKRLAIAAVIILSTAPTYADRYTYACKANGKRSVIRIDDTAHKLSWNGKTYVIRETTTDCPRIGWKVSGNGKSFDFCVATQGMADFKDGSLDVRCDQSR